MSYQDFKNSIDFFVRSRIGFSRKNYRENGVLFTGFKQGIRQSHWEALEDLVLEYGLSVLLSRLSILSLKDILFHLSLLHVMRRDLVSLDRPQGWLDLGSKNFAYCVALEFFCRALWPGDSVDIVGIELDANRLYPSLYSRKGCAGYYTTLIPRGSYMVGDLNDLVMDSKAEVVSWFFPFVSRKPFLSWGLPLRYFNPERDFASVSQMVLANEAVLLVYTYTAEERDLSWQFLNKRLRHLVSRPAIDWLSEDGEPVYCSLWQAPQIALAR
jgi:hypothetical protein